MVEHSSIGPTVEGEVEIECVWLVEAVIKLDISHSENKLLLVSLLLTNISDWQCSLVTHGAFKVMVALIPDNCILVRGVREL